MANGTSFVTHRKKTIGDVAVDGLLAGMAAGLAMGVVLVFLGLLDGAGPLETLGRFDPAGGESPLIGALMHLAVAGFYGVGFALIVRILSGRWSLSKRYLWLLGIAYGIILWLAARFIVLPGINRALAEIPTMNFLWAHVLYGIALGYLMSRHQND